MLSVLRYIKLLKRRSDVLVFFYHLIHLRLSSLKCVVSCLPV